VISEVSSPRPKNTAPWRGRRRVKDARTKLIPPIRCTEQERVAIKAAADQAGLSVGAFLRASALGSAGPRAVRRIEAAQHSFARLNQAWHERARRLNPDWPQVPYQAYYALAGATTELVRTEMRQGRIGTITGLADTLIALFLAVLAAQPWPSREPAPAGQGRVP